MGDLAAFILDRVGEDEAAAERGRRHNAPETFANDNYGCLLVDPARVLTQCAALRAVVEIHESGPMLDHYEYGCTCGFRDHRWSECKGCGAHLDDEGEYDRGIVGRACPTLCALASIWAEHDDYDPEWRLG